MLSKVPGPSEDREAPGLSDRHVESFADRLRAAGYAERSVRGRGRAVKLFARWTRDKGVPIRDLDDSHVAAFLERSRRTSKERIELDRAALRLFLRHLRAEGEVQWPRLPVDSSATAGLEETYAAYLRNERGLTDRSIAIYLPFIHDLLTELLARTGSASPGLLDAPAVRDFLLARVGARPSESTCS